MKILPKIIEDLIEITIERIQDNNNTKKLKQREWKNNKCIENIVQDISEYMSKTYFYPEEYKIIVSEKEFNCLLEDLSNLNNYNFYLTKLKDDLNPTKKAYLAFAMSLNDIFWNIYEQNGQLIKNLRLGRK